MSGSKFAIIEAILGEAPSMADRQVWEQALKNPAFSSAKVAAIFRECGYQIGKTTIKEYRKACG